MGVQFKEAVGAGSAVLGVMGALCFGVFLVLYYIKSALGIDLFKDSHLSDLFS